MNSTLNLIVLAYSDWFTETKAINKSISLLGDIFTSLLLNMFQYKNSKLTFSLCRYMEGSYKKLMMVNTSPKSEDLNKLLQVSDLQKM